MGELPKPTVIVRPIAPDEQPVQKFSQGSTPEFSVADPASVSISVELRKRLPTDRLARDVQDALLSIDISAKPLQPTPGFASPGDDDFSFADGDGLGERLNAGYPGLDMPLVLVTVAERGPYVIAAAHVFSPDGRGSGKVKRIARYVVGSAEANESHVKAWPDCFAEAVKRFKENPQANVDDSCAKLTLKGAVEPGSGKAAATAQPSPPSADVPSVATPAQTAQPTQPVPGAVQAAPGQRKAQGMLDDVEVTRDKVVVIVPPDAPSKGGGFTKPAARPEPPPKAAAQPEPANTAVLPEAPSNTAVLPESVAKTPVPPTQPGKPSSPVSRNLLLMEQIIAYGYVWAPQSPAKVSALALAMANRTDGVGECLARGRMSKAEIASMIQKDLAAVPSNPTRVKVQEDSAYFQLIPNLTERSIVGSARDCITNPTQILPFYYYVYPPQDKIALIDAQDEIADRKKDEAKSRRPATEWRLPTTIEAFAIASAIIIDKPNVQMTFWLMHNNGAGILSIKKKDGLVEVDYTLDVTPATRTTTLITVHY